MTGGKEHRFYLTLRNLYLPLMPLIYTRTFGLKYMLRKSSFWRFQLKFTGILYNFRQNAIHWLSTQMFLIRHISQIVVKPLTLYISFELSWTEPRVACSIIRKVNYVPVLFCLQISVWYMVHLFRMSSQWFYTCHSFHIQKKENVAI